MAKDEVIKEYNTTFGRGLKFSKKAIKSLVDEYLEKEKYRGIKHFTPSLGETLKSLGVDDIITYEDFKENQMKKNINLNTVIDMNYVNTRIKKRNSCDDDEIEEVDLEDKRKGDEMRIRKANINSEVFTKLANKNKKNKKAKFL